MTRLNYYNAKTGSKDSVVCNTTHVEEAIIDNCVLKYGDDFYMLTHINEFKYKLNDYITCEISFF